MGRLKVSEKGGGEGASKEGGEAERGRDNGLQMRKKGRERKGVRKRKKRGRKKRIPDGQGGGRKIK